MGSLWQRLLWDPRLPTGEFKKVPGKHHEMAISDAVANATCVSSVRDRAGPGRAARACRVRELQRRRRQLPTRPAGINVDVKSGGMRTLDASSQYAVHCNCCKRVNGPTRPARRRALLAELPQHPNGCKKSHSQVGRHWPALPMFSPFRSLRLRVTLSAWSDAAADGWRRWKL